MQGSVRNERSYLVANGRKVPYLSFERSWYVLKEKTHDVFSVLHLFQGEEAAYSCSSDFFVQAAASRTKACLKKDF